MGVLDAPSVPASVIRTPGRTQLALNGGLLVDATGWTSLNVASGTSSFARSSADPPRWSLVASFTANQTTVGGGVQYGRTTFQDVSLPAVGQTVAVACNAISTRRQRLVALLKFYDHTTGLQVGSTNQGSSVVVDAKARGTLTVTGTVPSGATTAIIQFVAIFASSDGVLWRNGDQLTVNRLMIEAAASTGPFFTGADTGCAWTGTANASTATTRTPSQQNAQFNGDAPTVNGVALPTQGDLDRVTAALMRRKAWVTGMSFAVEDVIQTAGLWYLCLVQHIAGTFLTDLTAGKWLLLSPAQEDVRTPPRGICDWASERIAMFTPRPYEWPLTVAWSASGFSLTTLLGASYQEFLYSGSPPIRRIGIVPTTISNASTTFEGNGCNGSSIRQPYSHEFLLTAPTDADGMFVITHALTTGGFAVDPGIYVEVDGRAASVAMVRDPSPVSASYRAVKVSGIPAGKHVVRVTMQSMDWRSIAFTQNAVIAATTATKKKLAILGDSWPAGGGTGNPHPTFPLHTAWKLARWLDMDTYFMGQGSTGYVATPGGTSSVFGSSDRLTALYSAAPDYIAVVGSQNDDANSATVQAAAAAMYSAILTNLPSAKIVVVGPTSTGYDLNTNRQATVTALKAAAAAASANVIGGYVIDRHNEHWMSGNGYLGAPDGLGVSDSYMYTDHAHLSLLGDAYDARRILEAWLELFMRQGLVGIDGFKP